MIKTLKNALKAIVNGTFDSGNIDLSLLDDERVALAAVQQDGLALKHVKNQTLEICLAAVQQNGFALEFVRDKTPEIYWIASLQIDKFMNAELKHNEKEI